MEKLGKKRMEKWSFNRNGMRMKLYDSGDFLMIFF